MRDEGLLKLFFADALPREEALEILRSMRSRREAVHQQLLDERGQGRDRRPLPPDRPRGGIEFTEWFADWCERMEAQLLDAAPDERSS